MSLVKAVADTIPVAVRAFVAMQNSGKAPRHSFRRKAGPSEFVLVFDTETTTDAPQALRFGTYQARKDGELIESGIFYEPEIITPTELALIRKYGEDNKINVLMRADFTENVFFKYGFYYRGTVVGFNLPFDLSRLAIRQSPARGAAHGGFSFELTENRRRPRIRVKHLSVRAAFIEFTGAAGQRHNRIEQKRKRWGTPPRRGFFVDLNTLSASLTSQPFSLRRLAEYLDTPTRKVETDEHGKELTSAYLDYAMGDAQVTWECFADLCARYDNHGLVDTHRHKIFSEASIGKAYLRQMRIRPWQDLQPDFPPELLGTIMSTYFGGRSEVHLRRTIAQVVYCDFLSMYPTVCTLMGLWRFVIARRIRHHDATDEIRALVDSVTTADLRKPDFWPQLAALVQVLPAADILPVRAKYDERQLTIGLNHLTSDRPVWFTLADIIASKLLTGKAPRIVKAIRFSPGQPQRELQPINILGNAEYRVDPYNDDFFRRAIDLRTSVKAKRKSATATERMKLDTEQQALKILANATSYGIFVELNVKDGKKPQPATCYGPGANGFPVMPSKVEAAGPYFHPLLATLITGAARLLLAVTEKLITDKGLDWALCDTDSMAIAKPDSMGTEEFLAAARSVVEWFTDLNPYQSKGPLLKIEDVNFGLDDASGDLCPLYCLAVSAKRYVLFNQVDGGNPIIRKASAHGLGHLRAPYAERDAPASIPIPLVSLREMGVERWQHDLWYQIIMATLEGHPERVMLHQLPGFDRPAGSRYHATTPAILGWFDRFNHGKTQLAQVKPFNFLLSFSHTALVAAGDEEEIVITAPKRRRKVKVEPLRPVASYNPDVLEAARNAYDRDTGRPIAYDELQTYAQALAQYHLHPEAKFENGDYWDKGPTVRRHVIVSAVNHIGKEANRWEEQFHLGPDPEAQLEYGFDPDSGGEIMQSIQRAAKALGQRGFAKEAGVSLRQVSSIVTGKARPTAKTVAKLLLVAKSVHTPERTQLG
jgi:hypothetical protein